MISLFGLRQATLNVSRWTTHKAVSKAHLERRPESRKQRRVLTWLKPPVVAVALWYWYRPFAISAAACLIEVSSLVLRSIAAAKDAAERQERRSLDILVMMLTDLEEVHKRRNQQRILQSLSQQHPDHGDRTPTDPYNTRRRPRESLLSCHVSVVSLASWVIRAVCFTFHPPLTYESCFSAWHLCLSSMAVGRAPCAAAGWSTDPP